MPSTVVLLHAMFNGWGFVATLFPKANDITGIWGGFSTKPISWDVHRAIPVFPMDIYCIGYIGLGSCMLKKNPSATFFTVFISPANNQVNDTVEKLLFLH